jgi:hypothetical protein
MAVDDVGLDTDAADEQTDPGLTVDVPAPSVEASGSVKTVDSARRHAKRPSEIATSVSG